VGSNLQSLIEELKRRRVFRAVIGYGVVAFAALQIIEPIMHGLHWPDAVLSYLVVALAIGFPVVVGLAWIFDVNAGRVERTGPAPGVSGTRLAALLAGVAVVAAAPVLAWYFFLMRPGPRAAAGSAENEALREALEAVPPASDIRALPSIAVLPLVNMSRDPEQDYFADGLAEELLNLLAKVPGLHVAARTSAFAFKGKNAKMSEIGRELGVATLLEGSVRKSGDQVRITTQLINASNGYHLWSETYDRKLTDIFAVQDEIARAVVGALKIQLLPGQSPSTDEHRTSSSEAYLHYLEGRKLMAVSDSVESGKRAKAAFQRTVELDPAFAPGWAGLGWTRTSIAESQARTPAEMQDERSLALKEMDKSIALGPGLAESYAIRGLLRIRFQYDWNGARTDFERALALNPDEPLALAQYGFFYLAWRGRLPEAGETLRKAIERDPLNPVLRHHFASVLLFKGDLPAARKAFDREYEICSHFSIEDLWPIYLLILEGKPAEALEASRHSELKAWQLTGAALAFHALGNEQESLRALADLSVPEYFDFSVQVAQVHAFRGENDSAFEWLDRAYQHRDPGMMRIKIDPLLRKLSGDPRYAALLAKMNLPPE